MRAHKMHFLAVTSVVLAVAGISSACADAPAERKGEPGRVDFGLQVQRQLERHSRALFGVGRPLDASAPETAGAYRTPGQEAGEQVLLAEGLEARYLTREAGNKSDMMAFWPVAGSATHLITCVEGGREVIGLRDDGSDKFNPSVQRIELATGEVETVLRGMDRCDGIRTTGWGTVLVTEETDDGSAWEILDPLEVTEATVLDRGKAGEPALIDDDRVTKRIALPVMAWEGLVVLESGVVIGGDELRPGTAAADVDGGAIFKFVPAFPRSGTTPVASLEDSPLADGSTFAMQVSCKDSRPQYGQGCEVGNAAWIPVNAATARSDADTVGATGYYRPEDMHLDPLHAGPGVRFCWTNTGNEGAGHYGEVMCGVDSDPLVADADSRSVLVNRFVEGDEAFNAFDNLAFQPRSGNLYVVEDHVNGDIFACLPDGADRDIKSDGCVRILSVRDSSAEPTGFIFSADGTRAYLSIQHSLDDHMPLVDDYRTDDILEITGFRFHP